MVVRMPAGILFAGWRTPPAPEILFVGRGGAGHKEENR